MPYCSQGVDLQLFQQQKQLIIEGNKDSFIFIGAHSGTRASEKKTKAGTLDIFLGKEEYKSAILDPKTHLDAAWQVYLNEAFMEGAILSGRKIKLVTDFDFYDFSIPMALNNGTFYELLALKENGFKFFKSVQDGHEVKILALPPSIIPSEPNLECFKDYEQIYHMPKQKGAQKSLMDDKFESLYKRKSLDLIQAIQTATQIEQPIGLTLDIDAVLPKIQPPSDENLTLTDKELSTKPQQEPRKRARSCTPP